MKQNKSEMRNEGGERGVGNEEFSISTRSKNQLIKLGDGHVEQKKVLDDGRVTT